MVWFSANSLVALYSIIVGFLMIVQWVFLFATKQVPELHEKPRYLAFHLVAESLTATLLIVSGAGLLIGGEWARVLSPVALGMVFYIVVVSIGYYAQQNSVLMIALFTVLTVLTILAIVALFFPS